VRRALALLVVLATACAGGPRRLPDGAAAAPQPEASAYAAPGAAAVDAIDLDLVDAARGRTLPVRLRVPRPCDASLRRPLVLFSHGLGGSREGGAAWGAHWASHGLAVLHLQHPGSDTSSWRGRPFAVEALRDGMTTAQYVARVEDVRFAIDRVAALAATRPELACVDARRVGMSGHSFGALTTQAVAGQWLPAHADRAQGPWARDARVVAAIAFSPSVREGARGTLAGVGAPVLAVTGSLDGDVAGTGATPSARRATYDALPPGRRALLWLDGADHRAFAGGPPRPGGHGARPDAEVQRAVRAVTLAFWRATLQDDAAARAWLDADGPRALLGPADAWRPR
jgi:predicted dienelactone hydrolase